MLLAALVGAGLCRPVAAQNAATTPVAVPQAFRVQVPDGAFLLAVPQGLCFYPPEVIDRMADFLVDAQPALLAGECGGVAALLRDKVSVVGQSLVAMIMNSDVDPATRRTEAQLLDGCRAWFPAESSQQDLAKSIAALNQTQSGIRAEPEVPVGLLRSDPRAVYGATIGRAARGQDHVLQIKVLSCLAPLGYPVILMFQGLVAPDYPIDQIKAEVRSLLSTAVAQVETTLRINEAEAGDRIPAPVR